MTEETPRERIAALTDEMVAELKKNNSIDSVVKELDEKGVAGYNNFPQNPMYPWNYDQMGPIYIPEEGATVKLDLKSLPLYKKIITEYEATP